MLTRNKVKNGNCKKQKMKLNSFRLQEQDVSTYHHTIISQESAANMMRVAERIVSQVCKMKIGFKISYKRQKHFVYLGIHYT